MSPPNRTASSAAAAIKRAITEENRDLTTQAVAAAGMGLLTSLGLYVFIILICFVFFFGVGYWFLYASGIFALFFLVGLWSGRRGVDPLANVDPFDEDDFGAVKATYALTGFIASPRHTVAGFASLIIHGPRSLLASVGIWRSRIRADDTLIAAATKLLSELGRASVATPPSKDAAAVLLRLGLIKLDRAPKKPPALLVTAKGQDALSGR